MSDDLRTNHQHDVAMMKILLCKSRTYCGRSDETAWELIDIDDSGVRKIDDSLPTMFCDNSQSMEEPYV
ncbi:unnamed protein product [Parnassius apollo]|uniref:(apollo) hypothetical protein n=1 Tax=Parnassius apollo TaxID=110799 RepID=A0A8S3WHI0_PARAO|nr:unnamed protein product [Parnassius apollo]